MEDLTTAGQKWLFKAGMSGNAFRLPEKVEPGKFDQVISLWYTCFCGNMKTDQIKVMHAFKYLWRRDDSKIAVRPNRGVARDLNELKFLMGAGRIDRDDFAAITVEEWAAVESLQTLVCEDIPEVKEKIGAQEVVKTASVAATDSKILATIDTIINGITNGYYRVTDGAPGATAKAYFAGAKAACDAMEVVCTNMEMYLCTAIAPSFANGSYSSYESLMAALRRYYGVDEFQETMVDIIKKIVKVAKKEQRMEQKVAEFRELAHRLMIVDKEKWLKTRDFTDDRSAFMEAAENYGPMLNSMFTALVMSLTIPQSRWSAIQTLFNARSTDTSYRGWHLNRPELYKILDAEKKVPNTIAGVEDADDTIAYAGKFNKPKPKKKNAQKSKSKSSNKKKSSKSGNTVDRMCRHCTQHMNKPVYHDFPYGGGKNCRIGKNGKPKKSRRINQVDDKDGGSDSTNLANSNNTNDDSSEDDEDDNDSDSDVGALYEEYFPSFGGGFGADI